MKAFMQLVAANAKEMLRDRMATFWFLAFPVLFILLFGAIFSGNGSTSQFDIGLVAEEQDVLSQELSRALQQVPAFIIHSGPRQEEMNALREGHRSLVVVLPAGLTRSVQAGNKVEIPVFYDASQQLSPQVLLPAVGQVLDEFERRTTKRPRLFVTSPQAVQSAKLRDIDYLLPSILAMALMQLGLFGSMRLVSLRERKILRRLGATPLPRSLLMGSEVVVRLLMALLQTVTIIVIGQLVFGVRIMGGWLEVVGVVILGASTFVSLGYMLVSFVKSEESGHGIIQLVQFPMMFLSGIFFPVSMMPSFLRPVVKAMPLTYLGDALRQIMTGSPPLNPLGTDLLVLAAWLLATLLLGIRFFQWE